MPLRILRLDVSRAAEEADGKMSERMLRAASFDSYKRQTMMLPGRSE